MGIRHLRFSINGTLYNSGQTWSCGLNFMSAIEGAVPTQPIASQTGLEDWSTAIRALNGGNIVPGNLLDALSSSGRILGFRCSDVDAQGREDAVSIVELGAPIPGTSGAAHPGQMAVCITTLTNSPGASNRGRMYWPALGLGTNGLGRISANTTLAIANAAGAFIRDLQSAGGTVTPVGIGAFVVSNTRGSAKRIERISVGDRLDVQRRRADKEKEIYAVASVPD